MERSRIREKKNLLVCFVSRYNIVMRRVALLTSQGEGRQRHERISPDSDVCISNGHLLAIFFHWLWRLSKHTNVEGSCECFWLGKRRSFKVFKFKGTTNINKTLELFECDKKICFKRSRFMKFNTFILLGRKKKCLTISSWFHSVLGHSRKRLQQASASNI